MNELSIDLQTVEFKKEEGLTEDQLRRGRSRILSLYKAQNMQGPPERRRSFLKVFSKQNKDKEQPKNMNAVIFKNKVKDCSTAKSIKQKSDVEYLIRADQHIAIRPIQKNAGMYRDLKDSVISERVTLQPRKAAKKFKLSKNSATVSRQTTKDSSHSEVKQENNSYLFKNQSSSKLLFPKNQTPVNYLTMLEQENPWENEENACNPFLNY